jgi:hypothetical protein
MGICLTPFRNYPGYHGLHAASRPSEPPIDTVYTVRLHYRPILNSQPKGISSARQWLMDLTGELLKLVHARGYSHHDGTMYHTGSRAMTSVLGPWCIYTIGDFSSRRFVAAGLTVPYLRAGYIQCPSVHQVWRMSSMSWHSVSVASLAKGCPSRCLRWCMSQMSWHYSWHVLCLGITRGMSYSCLRALGLALRGVGVGKAFG